MEYFSKLPLEKWTNEFVDGWFIPVFSDFFDAISRPLEFILEGITDGLLWVWPELIAIILILIAYIFKGKGLAIFTIIGIAYIASVHLWTETIQTLAIVVNASFFCILIGLPIGILSAKYKSVDRIVRPVLDFMQTLPSFVYLIPTILLFGIGGVPAVISTFVFATPPTVRLTSLGIKQVPIEVVEASKAFGSTSFQTLRKVQLPLAMPTIITGINQTIMLALSMAVIAAMIGSPGLGSIVYEGVQSTDVGQGLVGGLAIVVLAIILDRITEGIGEKQK